MWHVFFLLPSAILWPAAGLAAQPPHLKEQSDAQRRLWRGVSTSWCNQLVDWEATPDLSRALRREKSKRWSFLRKCDRIGSIFGGIDSTIMESSRRRELLNEVLLFARVISFQSAAIFLCPKGTTQISHGIKTKCRKTRAMQREILL